MASILTFDSNSLNHLLQDSHKEYFDSNFPLFYKNKIQKSNNREKYYYRSAIDSALKNNQLRAVQSIIDYITVYQNNYISSFLFQQNVIELIDNEITITGLLASNIFSYDLDFDEWPGTHTAEDDATVPYSGSFFNLRYAYDNLFPDYPPVVEGDEADPADRTKLFKIKYKVNLIPMIDEYAV